MLATWKASALSREVAEYVIRNGLCHEKVEKDYRQRRRHLTTVIKDGVWGEGRVPNGVWGVRVRGGYAGGIPLSLDKTAKKSDNCSRAPSSHSAPRVSRAKSFKCKT